MPVPEKVPVDTQDRPVDAKTPRRRGALTLISRATYIKEGLLQNLFLLCAFMAVAGVLLIFVFVGLRGWPIFAKVGLIPFLTGTKWLPSKGFFGRDYRFLSHGCVRVQGVYDLAAWLLRDSGGDWTAAELMAQIGHDREDLRLVNPVPVIWVYMTGWASADGAVRFADDVYQVDTIGLQADAR